MGTLFIVATPIGNLQDMTPRAIDTLRQVNLIAAEDTRHSGLLRSTFSIATPMISYHHHNRQARQDRLLKELAHGDIALISDAGTPGIADPGMEIIAAAHAAGHHVVPIPGASAMVAAVAASGLVAGPFVFLGFLTRKGDERRTGLVRAAATGWPIVLFESPIRLGETLAELRSTLGDREAVIARELTKLHEEIVRAPLSALAGRFAGDVRGEIVIVIGAAEASATTADAAGDPRAVGRALLAQGLRPSRAARELAAITGLASEEAYVVIRDLATDLPT